jgi:hypothetical protein
MPDLYSTTTLTANQRFRPLTNWRYRRLPYRAQVTMLARTTGASGNVQQTVTTGTTETLQRSPVSVGGTSGVLPTHFTVPVHSFVGDAGDEIDWLIEETAAATPVVDLVINVEPI